MRTQLPIRGDVMNVMTFQRSAVAGKSRNSRYTPPTEIKTASLSQVLSQTGRGALEAKQFSFLTGAGSDAARDPGNFFYSGDLRLLAGPAIAIVGTRQVSKEGAARARRLARELSEAGVLVVSGLAMGVDTEALQAAVDAGGKTAAVLGTPLDRVTPVSNTALQEEIYSNHLLISQFEIGSQVHRSNFPKRNRLMAAISDGSVIVEASDSSGTLHQAAECQKLGRWLFLLKSVVENPDLSWPEKFVGHPKTVVVEKAEDILSALDGISTP